MSYLKRQLFQKCLYKKYKKESNHEFDYYCYEIFDKMCINMGAIIKVISTFLSKTINLYF